MNPVLSINITRFVNIEAIEYSSQALFVYLAFTSGFKEWSKPGVRFALTSTAQPPHFGHSDVVGLEFSLIDDR